MASDIGQKKCVRAVVFVSENITFNAEWVQMSRSVYSSSKGRHAAEILSMLSSFVSARRAYRGENR